MNGFIKQIELDGQPMNFHFTEIITPSGLRYTIETEEEKPLFFQMQLRNEHWKIIDAPKVPAYLHHIEEELAAAILQQTTKRND